MGFSWLLPLLSKAEGWVRVCGAARTPTPGPPGTLLWPETFPGNSPLLLLVWWWKRVKGSVCKVRARSSPSRLSPRPTPSPPLTPSLHTLPGSFFRDAEKEESRLRLPPFGDLEKRRGRMPEGGGARGWGVGVGGEKAPYDPASEPAPLIWCLNIWCGKITHKISY